MASWVITGPSASCSTLSITSSCLENDLEEERAGERPFYSFHISAQPDILELDSDDEEDGIE